VLGIRGVAGGSRSAVAGQVRFLVDAQLPPALSQWLREQGHEAQAVREIDLREAEDGAIWDHAQQIGAAILTKDEDFATRAQQVQSGPTIVWLRIGNSSNAALRSWLEPRLPGIVELMAAGNRLIEVI
jgi:predicted nuclease of predicted toxin-antitoxin system